MLLFRQSSIEHLQCTSMWFQRMRNSKFPLLVALSIVIIPHLKRLINIRLVTYVKETYQQAR